MKTRRLIFGLSLLIFTACGNSSTNPNGKNDKASGDNNGIPAVSTVECIKNAIYYLPDVEINTYDSLDTRHFHQVLDYTHSEAIRISEKITHIHSKLAQDSVPDHISDSLQVVLDNARFDLNHYEKEIVGYVFVHSFKNKADTLSAIIIMDKDCASSEAIKVNTIRDINPDDYLFRIRTIDKKLN